MPMDGRRASQRHHGEAAGLLGVSGLTGILGRRKCVREALGEDVFGKALRWIFGVVYGTVELGGLQSGGITEIAAGNLYSRKIRSMQAARSIGHVASTSELSVFQGGTREIGVAQPAHRKVDAIQPVAHP